VTVAEIDRTAWGPHLAFDPSTAFENGPTNGGERAPCPGTIMLVGGPDDAVLLACCTSCSYEGGVRRADLEVVPPPPATPVERWWDK
jgi:hypothetical protein